VASNRASIRLSWAAGAVVAAAIACAPGASRAATVLTIGLRHGLTTVDQQVPHDTGARPPAIMLTTRPAGARCSVIEYHYGAHGPRGRFQMTLRCLHVPRGARASLVFRAPYMRSFPLFNGSSSIRVRIDTPLGNALPLGELTTVPRGTDCRVTRTGAHDSGHHFAATAWLTCRRLPRNARGVLAVGGLLAGGTPVKLSHLSPGGSAATSSRTAITARSSGCTDVNTLQILTKQTVAWKDCFSGPFTLDPWQSQWVGLGTPRFSCESGWRRNLTLDAFIPFLARTDVWLTTEPGDAWAYSWNFGLVTNWQFSGAITFNFTYRCFQVR
jgi:hypothetical protein